MTAELVGVSGNDTAGNNASNASMSLVSFWVRASFFWLSADLEASNAAFALNAAPAHAGIL